MFLNFSKSVAFQKYIWSFNTFINLVLAIVVHDNLKKDLFDGTFALSIHIVNQNYKSQWCVTIFNASVSMIGNGVSILWKFIKLNQKFVDITCL